MRRTKETNLTESAGGWPPEIPAHPKQDTEEHDVPQRAQQTQQAPHDLYAVSSHNAAPFLSGCSSSICLR